MKTFDTPMIDCYKCGGVDIEEFDTVFDIDGSMVQMIKCNECGAIWEERWIFACSVIEDEEE